MKKSLFKILIAAGVALLGFWLSVGHADTASSSSNAPLLDHYQVYDNARFAVRWQVTPGAARTLRTRLARYHYLVFYSSETLLKAHGGPYIQLGFFGSREEAQKFAQDNQAIFPGLSAVRVDAAEHGQLFAVRGGEAQSGPQPYYWLHPGQQDRHAGAQTIMKEARTLYLDNRFSEALAYYSVLSLVSGGDSALWARELMGLTYERMGQRELAAQTYRELLEEPQQGAWSNRVGQRLRALETAADDGQDSLRKAASVQTPYYWRGLLGQSYNQMSRGGKHVPNQDVLSTLGTHYDLTAGYRHTEHNVEFRLTGYDQYDLLDRGERYRSDNRTVIRRAQLDYLHKKTGTQLLLGRQRDYHSGMFQHFDGASIKYPVTDRVTVGATAGVPVQFSRFYDHMDRQFYSLQARFDYNTHWTFGGYLTQQTVFGETDRSALGGRAQYVDQRFSSFFNFDYDYEFAELNLLRWQGTYNINAKSNISAHYGRQRSPFLSATNILLGQPYLLLEDYLRDQSNRDHLLDAALERTSLMEYGSVSYHYRVDDNLHLTTDAYHSLTSEIPLYAMSEDGLTSVVDLKGAEYRYSAVGVQAVANDFFGIQDAATLGYRYSDTTLSSSHAIHISDRLRFFSNRLFITPKAQLKYTQRKLNDAAQTNLRGSLALSYRPWRNTELRLEGGNEVIRDHDLKNDLDYTYVFLGYQVRF